MSTLLRYASLRRLHVALGAALLALVFAPSASGAAQLDTATATGSSQLGTYSNINISAQSGTSGQNPSGNVFFTLFRGSFSVSGPVTCLSVTGADLGAGTLGSPTDAVMNAQTEFGVVTIELVDNGGNGLDTISSAPSGRAPTDCSPFHNAGETSALTSGRAVVLDAPPLPTSKDQCKNGGWRNFPQFKNQGQCVAFVEHNG